VKGDRISVWIIDIEVVSVIAWSVRGRDCRQWIEVTALPWSATIIVLFRFVPRYLAAGVNEPSRANSSSFQVCLRAVLRDMG